MSPVGVSRHRRIPHTWSNARRAGDDERVTKTSAPSNRRSFLFTAGMASAAAIAVAPGAAAAPVDSTDLDNQVSTLLANPASKSNNALVGGTAIYYVDDYVKSGDASDWYCWDRALAAAKADPRPTVVRAGAREYVLSKQCSLEGHSNLTIEGAGAGRTILSGMLHVTLAAPFVLRSGTVASSNIVFKDFTIKGALTNADALGDSYSRESREFVSNWTIAAGLIATGTGGTRGFQSGLVILGSRYQTGAYPVVRNVTVDGVEFWGLRSMPVQLYGISGETRMVDCTAFRCFDLGFRDDETVTFTGNKVEYSADNGVSISRGTQRVNCSSNTFIGSFYNGIWVGGYEGEAGPAGVVVSGNVVDRSARHGIWAAGGSKALSITGNTVTRVERIREWWEGCGIFLAKLDGATVEDEDGDGETDDDRFTANATITGNTLIDCDRGGILIDEGCANILVTSNLILRPGRATKLNGAAPDVQYGGENFGISTPGTSSQTSNVYVTQNMVLDDRNGTSAPSGSRLANGSVNEPASMGFGIHRPGGSDTWYSWDNIVAGASQRHIEVTPRRLGPYITVGDATSFSSSLTIDKVVGGKSALEFTAAGAPRWRLATNTAAETGGDKGSDLQLFYAKDDGTLAPSFTARRSDGRVTMNALLQITSGSARPDAAVAGTGSMFYDTTLKKPLFSDGSRWRTADGVLV